MMKWNRVLAGCLAAFMLFSLLPFDALAQEAALQENDVSPGAEELSDVPLDTETTDTLPDTEASDTNPSADTLSAEASRRYDYEIGYRFSESEKWVMVSADRTTITGSTEIERYERFDRNGNYAIPLPEEFQNFAGGGVTVYFQTRRDDKVVTSEQHVFTDAEDTWTWPERPQDSGNHVFSVYADWMDTIYYTIQGQSESQILREDFDANGNYQIELPDNLTFPMNVTFSTLDKTGGRSGTPATVSFRNVNDTENAEITTVSGKQHVISFTASWVDKVRYQLPGNAEVTVPDRTANLYFDSKNNYKILLDDDSVTFPLNVTFKVKDERGNEITTEETFQDPYATVTKVTADGKSHDFSLDASAWYGQVCYTPPGGTEIQAQPYSEDNADPITAHAYNADGNYVIRLPDANTFPVNVTMRLKGYGNPSQEITDAENADVTPNANTNPPSVTVAFQAQNASVTVRGHRFTLSAPNVNAVRYTIGSRTVTAGTDALQTAASAEEAADNQTLPDYVCFNEDGTLTIELTESEVKGRSAFPLTVHFQKANSPSDTEEKPFETPDSTQTIFSGDSVYEHMVSVHSNWLDEIEYRLETTGDFITVGNDKKRAETNSSYELYDSIGNFAMNLTAEPSFPKVVYFRLHNPDGSVTATERTFNGPASKVTLYGHEFSFRSAWRGEVVYRFTDFIDGRSASVEKTVVDERSAAWAETHKDDYATANPDGTYAIPVKNPNLQFPLRVWFRLASDDEERFYDFKNTADTYRFNGITFSIHPVWDDEVTYTTRRTVIEDGKPTLESYTVTVGTDEEQAREAEQEARRITEQKRQSDPDAKAEIPAYMLAVDRKHTIEVEDDAFFPYGVRFNYRRLEKVDGVWRTVSHENSWVWFENPNETQTVPDADNNGTVPDSAKQQIGSYEFSLHSERKDPNKLVKAGFRLGVTRDADGKRVNESAYVPLVMDRQSWDPVQHEWVRDGYWDPDRGTSGEMVREENYNYWDYVEQERDYDATLQSLLPLRETRLYANLNGFFAWELKNAELEIVAPDIPGTQKAKNSVAWGDAGSGTYETILKPGSTDNSIELSAGTYEMVVGQLDQLNENDMRYVVEIETDSPSFERALKMKAAYADAERSGIRIKQEGYRVSGTKYTDPATQKDRYIGAYVFSVNEQWRDSDVYMTMWLNDSENALEKAANYAWLKNLSVTVHEGVYLNVDAFREAASGNNDITAKVWGQELDTQPSANRYSARLTSDTKTSPYFTLAWYRNGVPVAVMPFQARVEIDPDAQWTPPDAQNPDKFGLYRPETQNTVERDERGAHNNWQLVESRSEYDESLGANITYYRVPQGDTTVSMASDRFYVSASYQHFTKANTEDGLGNKVTEDTLEPASTDEYYRSSNPSPSEIAQDDGTAYWQEYGIRVYAGERRYDTLAEAQADAQAIDVTSQIFTRTGFGAEYSRRIIFSAFNAAGRLFECQGIQVEMEDVSIEFGRPTRINEDQFIPRQDYNYPGEDEEVIAWRMPSTPYYSPSAMYSVLLRYSRDFREYAWNDIKDEGLKVIVSDENCSSMTYQEALTHSRVNGDITETAFTAPGYTANYSYGVHFHVYDRNETLIAHTMVITEEAEERKSADTWFRMRGAYKSEYQPNQSTPLYAGFSMPYTADSYYYNGYQTIFVMDTKWNDGKQVYVPIRDNTDFYPHFWSEDATIYGLDRDEDAAAVGQPETATSIQTDGKNRKSFVPGEDGSVILRYSAAGQNGLTLRNYWVTFLTQQTGGAKIFVNTANDESHWMKDTGGQYQRDEYGNPIVTREAFIIDGSHDVFFANIGDERLEELSVTLTDSTGNDVNGSQLRLDDYWTLDTQGKRYLNAFTTVDDSKDANGQDISYGGLPNIAKIRLYPVNPEMAQNVDAYLTIRGVWYDKDDSRHEEPHDVARTIHLSGRVGDIQIDNPLTDRLPNAVKWVPYAQLIHTNNIYGGSTVSFTHSGSLPDGMTLRPNGEIYGVPTKPGVFTFTVTANFSYRGNQSSDSRTYTLEVLSNEAKDGSITDNTGNTFTLAGKENVYLENDWNVDDDGELFGVEYWIPDMDVKTTQISAAPPYRATQASESDNDRRARNESAAQEQTFNDGYHDVVFAAKNYKEDGTGEDFEWFMDLWLNGQKLHGIRVDADVTDEEASRLADGYDFYYRNGSFYAVIKAATIKDKTNKGGATNTLSSEFRVGQDTSNKQRTSAQNFKVKGSGGTSTNPSNPTNQTNQTNPTNPSGSSGSSGSSGPPKPTYYSIATTFEHSQGKSVTLSATSASKGTTITVTVTPYDGYETASVSAVYGKSSKKVSVSGSGNNYSFKMPAGAVTVTVTFKLKPPSVFTARVTEVAGGKVSLNINSGTQGTEIYATVTPDPGRVVKALLVNGGAVDAFLVETIRATNEAIYRFYLPAANVTVVPEYAWETLAEFTDINGSMWFFQNAKWAYQEGIFRGVTEYDWMPNDPISSFTAVVTLGRLAKLDEDTLARYASANPDDYPGIPDSPYAPYARWAMDCGILQWGVYGNKETLTRAELAPMLKRFIELQGIKLEVPTGEARAIFTDQQAIDAFGPDADTAFQALNKIGVFQGRSDGTMDPSGNTKRSHLAALLNRISDFIRKYWTDKSAQQESQEPTT